LRYNRFHVTAMCSPTRAALPTGRNHHAVGMGGIPEFSGGFPGYSAMLPKDAAPFPKVLKENGYSTAAVGKWHLTPEKEQGPAGRVDRAGDQRACRLTHFHNQPTDQGLEDV
jgi:arylsulfatase